MDTKELTTIGVVAAGGIGVLVYVASQKTTTTSLRADPAVATTQANIIAANTTARNTQASESVALASLATGYETTFDNNQTAIALANVNGATNVSLGKLAANATYQSALLDTAAKITSTLSGAQTAQYTSYVTGQTALAGDAATTQQVGLQTAASTAIAAARDSTDQAIAVAQGTTQIAVAGSQAQASVAIGQAQAAAATTISANQTTVAVNAADRAASAAKSNGFWSAFASLGDDIAKIFVPSAAASPIGGGTTITDAMGVNNPTWGGAGSGAIAAAGG